MSIAPNPADLPSPANRYRLPERVHATSDLFNLVFGSIGARLDAAEGKSADYDAAIDRIIGQALATVSTALTVEIEAGRAEFEAVRAAFEELQSGGFSSARIAATLNGHPTVTHVQGALTTLLGLVRDLDALLPDVGETDGLKFLRAKADRSGFELAEVDLYSAALVQRVARSANVQIVKADKGKLFVQTGTFTQTVVSPATLGSGHHYLVKNAGTGNITIPASDGRTNWIMYPGEMRLFQCDGTTLRSEVLNPFAVTFIASGTFIMPPGYQLIEGLLWAGGGSGASGTVANTPGGGGGACVPISVAAAAVGTSVAFTIGSGGAAVSSTSGNPGGNSTFANFTAYGGGGGAGSAVGAGGGGTLGAPSGQVGGRPGRAQSGQDSVFGGGGGATASSNTPGGNSAYGGGGGGIGSNYGGDSYYGGAGGNGATTNPANSPISQFGGNGGAGSTPNGQIPGGGGAGVQNATSGAGARGELRIWGVV